MKPYSSHRPTALDPAGAFLPDRQEWRTLDGIARNRDSGPSLLMNTTRPANPADISFAPHCFAQDGVTVEWVVGGNLAPNYPSRFSSEAEAMAYARKTGRLNNVSRVESPRMVRVSWR
jgi:hypothetical protein